MASDGAVEGTDGARVATVRGVSTSRSERSPGGATTESLFARCREAARALERATMSAVSNREKCSALWGQAEATMLALEEVENLLAMYDGEGRVMVKRQCVSVLGRLGLGRTLAEVYGSYSTTQKLARYVIGWKTDAKFEEVTRDLEALEMQLWHMTGASGRLGVAAVAGDGRRRLLRGGVGQTLDSIFGAGVLAMCTAGSDGSELWWSTGGAFARLQAYDMFIQGQREIERPKPGDKSAEGGFMCFAGGSSNAMSLNSPIVTMTSAGVSSTLLWTGLRSGAVMAWDCDLGKLLSEEVVVVSRNEAVSAIAPIDATRAWVGCEDGTVIELRAPGSLTPDNRWVYDGKLTKTRDVVPTSAEERPTFGLPRRNNKGIRCMLHNADERSEGIVFIACDHELALEVWDVAEAKCFRVQSLDDLGAVVSLIQHPTVRDLIVSVHETGAVQIWGGDKCAVKPGDRVMTITEGFKDVDTWSLSPFSKYFGKTVVGAAAVETVLVIGHASGKLTVWSLPGAHELREASLHSDTLVSTPATASLELRSDKRVAHESGLVHLTKVDGGGSLGVITVGRFGSIMYWPLSQLEAGLLRGRKSQTKATVLGSPSKNDDKFIPLNRTVETSTLSDTARIAPEQIKLLNKIGEGSFGRVYKAQWNHIDVAVKFIGSDEVDLTSSALGRNLEELEKEVSIMTKLRHPNIVLLLGVVMSPRPAIVQEFCVRGSLYAVLQRHAKSGAPELTWRLRLQMALGAAAGMLYLHESTPTVLHRDLKSANLMVDRYYRVKVGDFNLSRVHTDIIGSGEGVEYSGNLHSPSWMAPEVLTDAQYSKASDVYSFAIVMWEIQSLQTPWRDLHVYQIVTAVPDGERLDATATHGAPFKDASAYQDLMTSAWQQDPTARPSFDEIVERVSKMLNSQADQEQKLKQLDKSELLAAGGALAPAAALDRKKSSSFSVRSSFKRRSVQSKASSVTESKVHSQRSKSAESLPEIVATDDLDATVVTETPYQTPTSSPDKNASTEGPLNAAKALTHIHIIDAGSVPSASLLVGMRARSSFNSSMRVSDEWRTPV